MQHQDLQTMLRCHMEAFAHLGGVPTILYDWMKTAVLGEAVVFAQHHSYAPRAREHYHAFMRLGRPTSGDYYVAAAGGAQCPFISLLPNPVAETKRRRSQFEVAPVRPITYMLP